MRAASWAASWYDGAGYAACLYSILNASRACWPPDTAGVADTCPPPPPARCCRSCGMQVRRRELRHAVPGVSRGLHIPPVDRQRGPRWVRLQRRHPGAGCKRDAKDGQQTPARCARQPPSTTFAPAPALLPSAPARTCAALGGGRRRRIGSAAGRRPPLRDARGPALPVTPAPAHAHAQAPTCGTATADPTVERGWLAWWWCAPGAAPHSPCPCHTTERSCFFLNDWWHTRESRCPCCRLGCRRCCKYCCRGCCTPAGLRAPPAPPVHPCPPLSTPAAGATCCTAHFTSLPPSLSCCCAAGSVAGMPLNRPFDSARQTNKTGGWHWVNNPQVRCAVLCVCVCVIPLPWLLCAARAALLARCVHSRPAGHRCLPLSTSCRR